ncbi:transcriptional regulator [Gluconacetobacter liquefaciens]|uniref:ArsR family transcriptional regulator n=1 Tax=Gluconacetobacter liquefaciens TaxID=89584 RepID=A0A370GAK4_GLULI|nr:metalloregulator ArsR/SmtB family transcription factor [Gluconacetobacter liquefaciens]MBB2184816.1 helix-turn-helix transcriptional regulator [Gluconacetobacter liquefaciens]RDI40240.1 ArsR family transcriptional regulator [Gluconacetobacter liquefaciens]GBQ97088.1 putative transcriptional regulator [Gluconacetobacter liquefaciens NRIC 0522]GEB39270.1 transcriptional regulator [Gluconacetobacter liquefaciens]
MDDLQANVFRVAELLKTLSHSDRLLIACALAQGEMSVGQIQSELSIYQPNLSRHLTVLKAARIVTFRKEGLSVFYRLSDEKAGQVIAALHHIYCERKE